ncbi:unnamed protein product [Dicrocoelium dendriticum]|nr:unnamed protein product [Dicrocoelium dendriticum]
MVATDVLVEAGTQTLGASVSIDNNIDPCYIPPPHLKQCTEKCRTTQVRCMSECRVHADECGTPYMVNCSSECERNFAYCMVDCKRPDSQ